MLQKYLKKLKVNDFSELSEEEKDTYRKWQEILDGRKLTDDEVMVFLNIELDETESKLVEPNTTPREDIFLKMKMQFIKKIKNFLKTPELEKKALIKQLDI